MEQLLADIQAGKPPSEETLKAAQASVDAGAKHEAEMAAMSPEEREKAIEEWATKLAAEVADLND
jgi:acyl-CoA reductase-like NAD-dependent aldehyde dehydrogenase